MPVLLITQGVAFSWNIKGFQPEKQSIFG